MSISRRSQLTEVRSIRNLKDARDFLGLSLLESAEALHVSKGLLADWQSGRRKMPKSSGDALAQLIANRLEQVMHRDDFGLIPYINPFRVQVISWCKQCREQFFLTHPNQRRCEKHRRMK